MRALEFMRQQKLREARAAHIERQEENVIVTPLSPRGGDAYKSEFAQTPGHPEADTTRSKGNRFARARVASALKTGIASTTAKGTSASGRA